VEEQVYLAWPLVVGLLPRKSLPRVFLAVAALSLAWKVGACVLKAPVEVRYMWTPSCLDAFAAGGLVAWMSRDPAAARRLAARAAPVAAGLGLFLLGMSVGQRHFDFWLNPAPMLTVGTGAAAAFFAALIGVLVTSPERGLANRVFSAGWLRWCGRYSYAAYLFHELVMALLLPLFPGLDERGERWDTLSHGLLFLGTVLACTFVAAWLSWHLWEKHFIALKRFFPGSGAPVVTAASRAPG
jgi:peptidoglycan/LPS O-acetylase OafA/YrhL